MTSPRSMSREPLVNKQSLWPKLIQGGPVLRPPPTASCTCQRHAGEGPSAISVFGTASSAMTSTAERIADGMRGKTVRPGYLLSSMRDTTHLNCLALRTVEGTDLSGARVGERRRLTVAETDIKHVSVRARR